MRPPARDAQGRVSRQREHLPAHPRLRACVLHVVRDSRSDGKRVRGVSRAGLLLDAASRADPCPPTPDLSAGEQRGQASVDGGQRSDEIMPRKPKSAAPDWWATYFDAQYLLEYEPIFHLEKDRHEVARLLELLELPAGSRVLDVPCGQGRHAHLLAETGFDVDGLDYSEHLLKLARKRGTGDGLRYLQGDMRRLPGRWTGRFDAVLNLFTSFGFFFDPSDDRRVIDEIARVLKPGGLFVFLGGSRDGEMESFLDR